MCLEVSHDSNFSYSNWKESLYLPAKYCAQITLQYFWHLMVYMRVRTLKSWNTGNWIQSVIYIKYTSWERVTDWNWLTGLWTMFGKLMLILMSRHLITLTFNRKMRGIREQLNMVPGDLNIRPCQLQVQKQPHEGLLRCIYVWKSTWSLIFLWLILCYKTMIM